MMVGGRSLVTLGAACLVAGLVWSATANRADAQGSAVSQLRLTSSSALASADWGIPAVVHPQCCPKPSISYRHHRRLLGRSCCPVPTIETVLVVANPSCCKQCPAVVPVCIPICCTGEPCVTSRSGLLGRGVVTYTWSCGYEIRVVFNRRGDVTVHYRPA